MRRYLVVLAVLLTPSLASCQWTVFDPINNATQISSRVAEVAQAIKIYQQAVSSYNFMQQMAATIQNMPARYQAAFAQWRYLSPANTYGNLTGWNQAVTTGNLGSGYQSATNPLQVYEGSVYASMGADAQRRAATRIGTIQLQDSANQNVMSSVGQIRANGADADHKLTNIQNDAYGGALQSQVQVAQDQMSAAVTGARLQADANKLLLSMAEAQILQSKKQRDEEVNAITSDSAMRSNMPTVTASETVGTGHSLDSFNLVSQ